MTPSPDPTLKKKKRNPETYAIYIKKLIDEINPNTGIGRKSTGVIDQLIDVIATRLLDQAGALTLSRGKQTLGHSEVNTAAMMVLPEILANNAVKLSEEAMLRTAESQGSTDE